MNNDKKAEIVFAEELEYIKLPGIKSFTLKCFKELTPNYFWDSSASSTQKYHPEICNKKHGIVLHTKLCVWWGVELSNNFGVADLDVIVSALLLHDLQKFGTTLDTYDGKPTLAKYWETHGPMLAIQMRGLFDNANVNEEIKFRIDTIEKCVALHMGMFTNKLLSLPWAEEQATQPLKDSNYIFSAKQKIEIVQLADYCASRKSDFQMAKLDNYEFPNLD